MTATASSSWAGSGACARSCSQAGAVSLAVARGANHRNVAAASKNPLIALGENCLSIVISLSISENASNRTVIFHLERRPFHREVSLHLQPGSVLGGFD